MLGQVVELLSNGNRETRGTRWGHYGARWNRGGPRWDQDGAKMEPRWAKIGQDGPTEVAKTVQDGAKMRPRHEKMSPIIVAIAGRFAVFAKNVLMKQVLDRGRSDRREKEPKCGHCRGSKRRGWRRWTPKWVPSGRQDGLRWGQDDPRSGQDGPRCGQASRK